MSDVKTPFQTVTSSTHKAGNGAVKEVKQYPYTSAFNNSLIPMSNCEDI